MQGGTSHPQKSQSGKNQENRRKKITKSRKFTKITTMPFTNGSKMRSFQGGNPPHPNFFFKICTSPKLILHTPLDVAFNLPFSHISTHSQVHVAIIEYFISCDRQQVWCDGSHGRKTCHYTAQIILLLYFTCWIYLLPHLMNLLATPLTLKRILINLFIKMFKFLFRWISICKVFYLPRDGPSIQELPRQPQRTLPYGW